MLEPQSRRRDALSTILGADVYVSAIASSDNLYPGSEIVTSDAGVGADKELTAEQLQADSMKAYNAAKAASSLKATSSMRIYPNKETDRISIGQSTMANMRQYRGKMWR